MTTATAFSILSPQSRLNLKSPSRTAFSKSEKLKSITAPKKSMTALEFRTMLLLLSLQTASFSTRNQAIT